MLGSHALKASSLSPADVARFWSKVEVKQYGCWPWKGSRQPTPKNYGTFRLKKKTEQAHRVAWALFNGEAPADLSICHNCDNPPCCRPEHMFEGTNLDNVRDSLAKGRPRGVAPGVDVIPPRRRPRGKKHGMSKLTDSNVKTIRLEAMRGAPRQELANRFGVAIATIGNVVGKRTWKHVK